MQIEPCSTHRLVNSDCTPCVMSMANSSKSSSVADLSEEQTSNSKEDIESPSTSSAAEPVPGPSHAPSCPAAKKSPQGSNKTPFDDPKPGPSTTAAEFDLEVFDSCSSCSLETDCGCAAGFANSSCGSSPLTDRPAAGDSLAITVTALVRGHSHAKGNKKNLRHGGGGTGGSGENHNNQQIPSDLDNSSVEDFNMASPIMPEVVVGAGNDVADSDSAAAAAASAPVPPLPGGDPDYDVPASACPSETEEATSERGDLDEEPIEEDDMQDTDAATESADDQPPVSNQCQCQPDSLDKCFFCSCSKASTSSATTAATSTAGAANSSASTGSPSASAAAEAASCSRVSNSHCKLFGLKVHCHSDKGQSAACSSSKISCQMGGGGDNTDQIVSDHDNFGTDENEDSLDSSSLMINNSRQQTIAETGSAAANAAGSSSQAAKRKVADSDSLSLDGPYATSRKKRKDETNSDSSLSVECAVISNNSSSSRLIEAGSSSREQHCSNEQQQQLSISSDKGTDGEDVNVEEEVEVVVDGSSSTNGDDMDCHHQDTGNNYETASVPSLPPATSSPEPDQVAATSAGVGVGMSLIPDKDNPPQEMLDWVESFSRWSHAQRLLAIDQLIGRCEPTQVRHMMAVIEPQFQRDFISLLPKELALYVLSFLKPRDLLNAAQTCRYWRILAEDNLLWREKCREAKK